MSIIDPKQKVAILRVLKESEGALGGDAVARQLQAFGYDLSGRTLRLYLREMEKMGLVTPAERGRNGGRSITPRGLEEIGNALVTQRVGFTAARADAYAWKMNFDPATATGVLILNITTIPKAHLRRAMNEMVPIFEAGLGMGDRMALAREGEMLGHFQVPAGRVAIGTVCSVTVNGVLLNRRIHTVSRFGGVLEVDGRQPLRFTDVIYYDGTSLDPLEIFIKGGLTSVREVARKGHGRIGASFREVPTVALGEIERTSRLLERNGLGCVLMLGKPNQPLLDFPVPEGRTGMILAGGLNPCAAIEEAGIPNWNSAMCNLIGFEKLSHFRVLADRVNRGEF